MNKILNSQNKVSGKSKVFSVAMIAIFVFSLIGIQSVSAAITSTLDFGAKGAEVTELQTYLATNATIYPSGLITGYFGSLTRAAVQRFQSAQGIVSSGTPETTGYGRVGPRTMARINELMGIGGQPSWDSAPSLSNPVVQVTSTTAVFTWTTNEPTQGQVYWSATPLQFYEETGPRQQPYVSGTLALDAGGLQSYHTVTLSNLQANTTYYFLVRGVDNVGNMSMIWPSFFKTNL